MKKYVYIILAVSFFLCFQTSFSQNLEATKQYLETRLEILSLQATIDVLANSPDI